MMSTLRQAVTDFLGLKRIAVAGVSRDSRQAANAIYRKLRQSGYLVFPINPNAEEVEGDACYPDLASVEGGVEGVVVATHPRVTERVIRDCVSLGVNHVWIHRSFGAGSVSEEAVQLCHDAGIEVIPGACPMMFCEPVDLGHRCMRWFLRITGGLPDVDVSS
jgi:predicted CoA-binding protein